MSRKPSRDELAARAATLETERTLLHIALTDQLRCTVADATEAFEHTGETPQTWQLFRARGALGGYVVIVTHDNPQRIDVHWLDAIHDSLREPASDIQWAMRHVVDRLRLARDRACKS